MKSDSYGVAIISLVMTGLPDDPSTMPVLGRTFGARPRQQRRRQARLRPHPAEHGADRADPRLPWLHRPAVGDGPLAVNDTATGIHISGTLIGLPLRMPTTASTSTRATCDDHLGVDGHYWLPRAPQVTLPQEYVYPTSALDAGFDSFRVFFGPSAMAPTAHRHTPGRRRLRPPPNRRTAEPQPAAARALPSPAAAAVAEPSAVASRPPPPDPWTTKYQGNDKGVAIIDIFMRASLYEYDRLPVFGRAIVTHAPDGPYGRRLRRHRRHRRTTRTRCSILS